jgi:diguanylate cyclase (GGDEF)-like protein
MLNFQSIKFRIIALSVVLVIVGILVRHFFAVPLIEERVQALAATQQMSVASYIAQDIDHNLTSRLALVESFAADLPPVLTSQPNELNTWLNQRQRINPIFDGGLLVIKPDGYGLLAAAPASTDHNRMDFAATDWFKNTVRDNKAVMGRPSFQHNNPAIVFSAPVHDAEGKIIATGGFLLVSPADKLFVAASDPNMIMKPTPPTGVNLLHDRAMLGYRGSGVTINAKGVEELSAMASVPSSGWFVVARMPTEEAFQPVTALRDFVLKANAILSISILVALLVMLSRILRPLTDASRAIHNMADGKARLTALPVECDDEVGKLVRGFNFLVAKLRREEASLKASEARLKFMAHHDYLTGLYNRVMLEDHVQQALARAERDDVQVALLFCDLDGFKIINDQHGHDVGDDILRQVATRLSVDRRRVDTVARLGGDEFIILLSGLSDARTAASHVAQQCLTAISVPFDVDGKSFILGISIGIALHSGTAIAPSALMEKADIAMYQAKHGGKGKFLFFEDENGTSSTESARINKEISAS